MTHTSNLGYIGGYAGPTKLFRGDREAVNVSIRRELVYCPQCRKQIYLQRVVSKRGHEMLCCPQCKLFYKSMNWKRFEGIRRYRMMKI